MPAPDGPQFALFHATPYKLPSGKTIEPRMGSHMEPDKSVAWATESLERAKYLAGLVAKREGVNASPVYGVSHLDLKEHEEFVFEQKRRKEQEYGGAPDYVSYKGFNPEKIVAWGSPTDT